jgi:hypothetical protein
MSVVRIAVRYVGAGSGTPTCYTATSQPIDIASWQPKTLRASVTTYVAQLRLKVRDSEVFKKKLTVQRQGGEPCFSSDPILVYTKLQSILNSCLYQIHVHTNPLSIPNLCLDQILSLNTSLYQTPVHTKLLAQTPVYTKLQSIPNSGLYHTPVSTSNAAPPIGSHTLVQTQFWSILNFDHHLPR